MPASINSKACVQTRRALPGVAILAVSLLLGACARTAAPMKFVDNADLSAGQSTAAAGDTANAKSYWASAHGKNPRDETAAVNYARILKADGDKMRALSILQQSAMYNPDSRAIASEYGRLALDMGDLSMAEKLLARADDADKPDWRVVSARGTLDAKQGRLESAQAQFERALALKPGDGTILNNLALAYALDGAPRKAETLLRQAAKTGQDTARIRQNLALVLGVQGKFDEAKSIAAADLDGDKANANVAFLKEMVKASPVQLAAGPAQDPEPIVDGWSTSADAAPIAGWASKVAAAAH